MPEHLSDVTPGGKANANFVASMQEDHPKLAKSIPNQCLGCSSAWLHALRGRADRLKDCPGREEVIIEFTGELVAQHFCHLPTDSEK